MKKVACHIKRPLNRQYGVCIYRASGSKAVEEISGKKKRRNINIAGGPKRDLYKEIISQNRIYNPKLSHPSRAAGAIEQRVRLKQFFTATYDSVTELNLFRREILVPVINVVKGIRHSVGKEFICIQL